MIEGGATERDGPELAVGLQRKEGEDLKAKRSMNNWGETSLCRRAARFEVGGYELENTSYTDTTSINTSVFSQTE